MAKHYDKQFKLDAVQYYHDHKNLGLQGCATNLGISQQTLSRWQKELRETGDIESRGSGNYASDEAKQNYGAPKIIKELRKSGEIISERTVGKYMKQMGIKAQWVKPWTTTLLLEFIFSLSVTGYWLNNICLHQIGKKF